MIRKTFMTLLAALALAAGCARNVNEDMWDCQLSVQKENAGKDAAAAAERARDIEACMEDRGFRLEGPTQACPHGAV
ncbi:MAG: hypothetical protein ACM3Y9_04935, partial [Ignavibacteria bacterium]